MDFFNSIPWMLIFASLAKTIFLIFLVVLPMVSYTVYAERRVSALIQDRLGPETAPASSFARSASRKICSCGSAGLGQPVADAVKFPAQGRLRAGAREQVLLLARPVPRHGAGDCHARGHPVLVNFLFGQKMVVADVNIGLLYIFAIASIGVYGIVLAGLGVQFQVFLPRRHPQLVAEISYEPPLASRGAVLLIPGKPQPWKRSTIRCGNGCVAPLHGT
jgi:NADH-quinone oxidoreductase subunit H